MDVWRSLLIGLPAWPPRPAGAGSLASELWHGLVLSELQFGGFFCLYQKFFGLLLKLPAADPLCRLADRYVGSSFPGIGGVPSGHATPLEEVVRLRDQLADLGLVLDPVRYAMFAEGYIPIAADSAWRYAVARKIPVFERPQAYDLGTTDLGSLGLGPDWQEATQYLQGAWDRLCGGASGAQHWTAAVH